MRRILVVDDDRQLRPAIQKALQDAGFEVTVEADGQAARQRLFVERFDLVLSDIRMPQLNGIDLLETIKKLMPTPVILMTGFTELCETEEASQLGAEGFLAKPFQRDELYALVKRVLGTGGHEAAREVDDHYVKLHLSEFVPGRHLPFEPHIRVSHQRYIRVAKRGEEVLPERIRLFASRGIHWLHVRKEEFQKYVGFSLTVPENAKDKLAPELKRELVETFRAALDPKWVEGLDRFEVEYALGMVENAVSMMVDRPDTCELLRRLGSNTVSSMAHAVGTGAFAVLIARQLRWTSIPALFRAAFAGLVHDCGELETADRKNHTSAGAALLSKLPGVPEEIAQVVAQHEERCAGQGFPKGIRRGQIQPAARLIAVADQFCEQALKHAPKECVSKLVQFQWDKLDPEYLSSLARLYEIHFPGEADRKTDIRRPRTTS